LKLSAKACEYLLSMFTNLGKCEEAVKCNWASQEIKWNTEWSAME